MMTLSTLAFGTPTIGVLSNRALPVRTLTYNRSAASEPLDERIERTTYSAAGFAASRIDPRLFAAGATPNFAYATSLTGRVLRTDSVDAGATIALADLDGRPLWSRDARGTVTTWTYDVLGRPLTVQEQSDTDTASVTLDVFCYGEAEPDAQQHNLRGQCVRHYDTAGRLGFTGFSLTGQPLAETRQLLADPEGEADWAGNDESVWQASLDATAYTTAWDYDATGAWLTQTDAMSNRQQRTFDVAGRLAGSSLTLASGAIQRVLSAIDYSAAGQVLSETPGNGVVSAYAYEPETQRLARLRVTRPAQAGRSVVLQNLAYTYDPVGNVLSVRDDAQSATYWRNQKVEPAQTYAYDALYQLIAATGRETASRGQQGAQLPGPLIPLPTDDSVYTNYTRTYAYDRAGNLTQIRHSAPASGNRYTTGITVSDRSNRAELARDGLTPDQVDALFDAGGHQGALLPGQPLDWNRRGELRQVTPVRRDGQMDDREWYRYGSDGMRVLKVSEQQSANTTQAQRVLYLPGLECRTTRTGDTETESLHVIRMNTSGRAAVRLLHWANGQPAEIDNDALRYSYGDLIGSSLLELDAQAELCSQEAYYPYGGTAIWTARSQIEADYKTIRYSGKERDATGLYYYGLRYYQPWIGRWLCADPAGTIDGLNLFRMVRNSPITLCDADGRAPHPAFEKVEARTKFTDRSLWGSGMREWELGGGEFKLHTRGSIFSDWLVIDAHGQHDPSSGDIAVPEGAAFFFLNPHYTTLVSGSEYLFKQDKLAIKVTGQETSILSNHAKQYIDSAKSIFEEKPDEFHKLSIDVDLLLRGSSRTGFVANYSLKQFVHPLLKNELTHRKEVAEFHWGAQGTLQADWLTISNPEYKNTLSNVLEALSGVSLQYKNIAMSFCRVGVGVEDRIEEVGMDFKFRAKLNAPMSVAADAAKVRVSGVQVTQERGLSVVMQNGKKHFMI